MKVIDPGHVYELDWLDGEPEDQRVVWSDKQVQDASNGMVALKENRLIFVKREGEKYPGNKGHHPGTNMQEVIRTLIDRMKYVDNQIPTIHNQYALNNLRSALLHLEVRAAERHGRPIKQLVRELYRIEELPTCSKCGHIGCEGSCH